MISIIIPTYNEKENILKLVPHVFNTLKEQALTGEIIIVDDASQDGTGEAAEKLKKTYPMQILHRPGKLGLASAFLEGLLLARYPILCLMDGDLSHPPELLPQLYLPLQQGLADIVVASRSIPGGKTVGWPWHRHVGSWVAQILARPLVPVRDTTSGYFMFKKSVISRVRLFPQGFKIGLEIMVRGNYKKIKEVPYTFQDRTQGKSKFGLKEILLYFRQLQSLYRFRFFKRR